MLEQVRGGRKVLWQMKKADPELENAKNIRFITSNYEDRFKIPDGDVYKRQDYTKLEDKLRKQIDRIETDHPGYDEYRYNLAEIGHNPYELSLIHI